MLESGRVPETMQHAAYPAHPNNSQFAGTLSMIFTVRHKKTNKELKKHRLICMPTTFQKDTEGRSQIYYTKEGIFVDTPRKGGIGLTYFTIAGHTLYRGLTEAQPKEQSAAPLGFGVQARMLLGQATTVVSGGTQHGSIIDGAAAVKDLEDTIRTYFFPDGSSYTPAETTMDELALEFMNLNTPTSQEDATGLVGYVIHPHRGLVTLRQDARQPFLWHYQLQFAGLRLLDGKGSPGEDSFLDNFTSKQGLLGAITDRLELLEAADTVGLILAGGYTLPGSLIAGTVLANILPQGLNPAMGGLPGLSQIQGALGFLQNLEEQANAFLKPFDRLVQNVTRPVTQFLSGVQELQNATRRFISGIARRIEFPLSLSMGSGASLQSLLNLPRHSVETLRQAAMTWSKLLHPLTLGLSLSKPGAGTSLRSGVNDRLTLAVNGGPPHVLDLGNLDGGPAIALAIQEAVRKIPPAVPSNTAAFREFTATYAPETGSYQLTSGTIGSPSASVVVLPSQQLPPVPNDAAAVLGLSPAHGGQEQQGSDAPLDALNMLRNVVLACTHLTAFPEYFAESLAEQTETVELLQTSRGPDLRGLMPSAPSLTPDSTGLVPVGSTVVPTAPGLPYLGRVPMAQLPIVQPQLRRSTPMQVLTATPPGRRPVATTSPVVRGDQRLTTVLLTPGDTLQSVAARVGVAWETLAVANGLHYPYVMTEPLTLLESRVQTATPRTLVDRHGGWAPHRFQGHRCDLLAGDGAGQSRRIADNDATTLYLETPWAHMPNLTTDYAIREASNPIIQNGTVTSATDRTLVDAQLMLVPESQRGYTLRLTRGTGMGQERRITQHTPTTYVLETPWDILPQPGTLYSIVAPQAPVRRTVLFVGEPIAVPRPSVQTLPRQVRQGQYDTGTITGLETPQSLKLFGIDLRLVDGDLAINPVRQDLGRIAGLQNVRQAVLHLLNLRLGDLDYAPGLGSYVQESLGLMATMPSQIELLHSVARTVGQDPRIQSMGAASLHTMGGQAMISFAAVTITGDTLERVVIR